MAVLLIASLIFVSIVLSEISVVCDKINILCFTTNLFFK